MASRMRANTVLLIIALIPLSAWPAHISAESTTHTGQLTHTARIDLTYRYLVTLPEEYAGQPEGTWPLILFLHGGGTPDADRLRLMVDAFSSLPAIGLAPICPLSPEGGLYTNWNWRALGELVRKVSGEYRVDAEARSVIGFSMGGSGAWELPFYEPELFSKVVVLAGVCHPWSLRHYPKIPVWAFVGADDYMRKEQQETVTSAKRFGVDVVETVWTGANHGGIFRNARKHQPMLDWLISKEDLRSPNDPGK